MIDFSDEDILLEEIKLGNNQAFEYLFKNYYPRLKGYAIRFIQNEEATRDIIQECFIKFWEKREVLSAISVISLLFAMVRNGCLNYLKHISIIEKYRLEYLATVGGEERLYYTDFACDADQKLLYDELREQVQLVIGQMSERCREVFILSRFDGLKNREIAEKLQVSTTAVEKHIAKALAMFSRHFKDKYSVDVYIVVLAWVIGNNG